MKKFLTLVIFAVLGASAFAQTTTSASTASDSAAVNSGLSQTINSYGAPIPVATSQQSYAHITTDQAQAVPPSFANQGAVMTCSAAGAGAAVQTPGVGVSFAMGGGMDVGCDLKRDIDIMVYAGASKDDIRDRVCMKAEIKAVMKACQAPAPAKVAQAPVVTADPYIASSGRRYPSAQ